MKQHMVGNVQKCGENLDKIDIVEQYQLLRHQLILL